MFVSLQMSEFLSSSIEIRLFRKMNGMMTYLLSMSHAMYGQ